MKLTDAFAILLKKLKVKQVFGLQGGAVVHFFDSLERNKIKVTYTNHEQSAALAGVAYAKSTENIGCVIVTTGPGSTNAISGLLAAWQDSIPCLFISGQSRSNHVSYGKKVRQVGTQEANICDIVRPITKYTKFIRKKETFVEEVIKATNIAKSGRPGPVWLDVPLEIQWSNIFFSKKIKILDNKIKKNNDSHLFEKTVKFFRTSKKPLLILGFGARNSLKNIYNLKKLILKYKIPFVTTWNAADLFPTNYPFNLGILGMSGQRGANKSVFKSDLLICLGTHLSIPHTTTLFENYAPKSRKIIVNIDQNQLKNLNVKFDLKINSDVNKFVNWLLKKNIKPYQWKYLNTFKRINWYTPKKNKYPNSNVFIKKLTEQVKERLCVVIDGGGTALYAGFQSSVIKSKDRIICSSSISSMGTGLAETIGAWKSKKFKKIICIIGDGSFLMNIQDLQTIAQDKINVSIVLINNNGYLAIRHTQKEFLNKRYFGTHPDGNLTMPSFKNVSKAFRLNYIKVNTHKDVQKAINFIKKTRTPSVCEVFVDENQSSLFKQGYAANKDGTFSPQPLSEMYPFLKTPIANTNN
ncbi:thiamine pyrophosphate-binding protein [Pelagibacteraceae bacterium]|nr:thiamine pyrophosphate-binding protein [Pelagibacteraceae bacterium]